MKKLMMGVVLAALATGCSTDKVHEWMRADPAPLTDFLPGKERLVLRPATFPFHYTWMNTNAVLKADFKNVYIAPVDLTYLRKGKNYDDWKEKAMGNYDELRNTVYDLDAAITDLGEYGRKALVLEFKEHEKETKLKVVDNPSLPHTMILEFAITAFVPTRAEIEIAGEIGGLFCPLPVVGFVADYLAAGSIAVECRARDSVSKEVVAMLADAEGEPSALLQLSKYTYTSSAKINLKRIAKLSAECCFVEDDDKLRRPFPFGIIALPWESSLNE